MSAQFQKQNRITPFVKYISQTLNVNINEKSNEIFLYEYSNDGVQKEQREKKKKINKLEAKKKTNIRKVVS